MCHSSFLSRLFNSYNTLSAWHNEASEEETFVTKCVGDEPRRVFSDPIYSNNSLLGKGSKWWHAISVWFLISAFLAEIKGHLEVLRDAVIWSAPLLEFLCCLPVLFCPSLSLSFHLSPSFLSVSVFSSTAPISETASFILSLTLFHPLITSFVVCVLVYFWHNKGLRFFYKFFRLSALLSTSVKALKDGWGSKGRGKRESESRAGRLPRKSVPCCPLHLHLPPFRLSPQPLSPPPRLASLVFIATGVCLCAGLCAWVSFCVCVSMHKGWKPRKLAPRQVTPFFSPTPRSRNHQEKADSAAHTKKEKRGKKERETENREEKEGESREGGQAQL